jgi:hypothetical protein
MNAKLDLFDLSGQSMLRTWCIAFPCSLITKVVGLVAEQCWPILFSFSGVSNRCLASVVIKYVASMSHWQALRKGWAEPNDLGLVFFHALHSFDFILISSTLPISILTPASIPTCIYVPNRTQGCQRSLLRRYPLFLSDIAPASPHMFSL